MQTAAFSKDGLDRLHEVMRRHVDAGEVPGLVTLVARHGEVHVDTVGTTTVGGEAPMRADTIFRVSSMTKPVTAVATMILVDECLLRLDDPVDDLLPELADRRVLRRLDSPLDDTEPARRPITVRDLLTFRMGFGIIPAPPGTYPIQVACDDLRLGQGPPSPAGVPEPDEWMRRFGALPLLHQPGERWMYNTGCDVLGVLVARAAGRPFDVFLRERIFEPLGMTDTAFSVPADKLSRFTTAYFTDWSTGELVAYDTPDGQWSRPPAFPSGAAGLVGTAHDFAVFGEMLLNRGRLGGERILSRAAVETMTQDHLTAEQKAVSGLVAGYFDSRGWGFGMSVVTRRDDPAEPVSKFGWDGGMGTSWYCDPSEDLVTVLMTPAAWPTASATPLFHDFWTAAYAALDD